MNYFTYELTKSEIELVYDITLKALDFLRFKHYGPRENLSFDKQYRDYISILTKTQSVNDNKMITFTENEKKLIRIEINISHDRYLHELSKNKIQDDELSKIYLELKSKISYK